LFNSKLIGQKLGFNTPLSYRAILINVCPLLLFSLIVTINYLFSTLRHSHRRLNAFGDARFWFYPNLIKLAKI